MSVTPNECIIDWLKRDFDRRQYVPSDESLSWLVEEAERAIKLFLGRRKPLRSVAEARQLALFAKHLSKAADAAERLGRSGFLTIAAVSGASIDIEDADVTREILHLRHLAARTERAAQVAADRSRSMEDDHGGPTPEQRLRQLIAYLLVAYEQHLGIRPTHTQDLVTERAERGFTGFVKQALIAFAPEGVTFKPRLIDGVVREMLPIRELDFFEPPAQPD